jgi:hypothetical protein
MEPVHYSAKRRFWVGLALLSTVLVAGGALIVAEAGNRRLTGWSVLLFFSACAFIGLREASRRGPRLTIDDAGVYDHSLAIGVIPWRDIRGIALHRLGGSAFIALELVDAEQYTARLSGFRRRAARTNVALGLPPLALNVTGLETAPERLADLLMREWARRQPDAAV